MKTQPIHILIARNFHGAYSVIGSHKMDLEAAIRELRDEGWEQVIVLALELPALRKARKGKPAVSTCQHPERN